MPTCPSQDWCYQFSWPCSRPLLTLVSECQTLTDMSASVSGGLTASFPWSWDTQGFVCSLQESLFPLGLWKFYNQILLSFRFVLQIKSCRLSVSLVREIFQARIVEWVAISPLQGIFLTQGMNPGLLADSLLSEPPGKPFKYMHVSVHAKSLQSFLTLWPHGL